MHNIFHVVQEDIQLASMKRIAIFASGNGSNAERIVEHFRSSNVAKVVQIITNRTDAFVRRRAERLDLPCDYFPKSLWHTGEDIVASLKENEIDFIILAGFLLKVPPLLISLFPNKILNIHPALLPKYGGKGMYGMNVHQAVWEHKEEETGITIHIVDEEYDQGKILFQGKCRIEPTDTPDSIAEKVHQLEYEYFPRVIEQYISSGKVFLK